MADDSVILTKKEDIPSGQDVPAPVSETPATTEESAEEQTPKTFADMVDAKVVEGETVKAEAENAFKISVDELQVPARGDQMTRKMLEATKNAVYVDLGQYGVGVIRGRELWDSIEDFTKVEPGTDISATVLESDNEEGMVEMSFRKATKSQVWEDLRKKMESVLLTGEQT